MKIPFLPLIAAALAIPASLHAQSSGPGGIGVAVGSSSLISTVQYSDTFTIGTDYNTGSRNGTTYAVGNYPLSTEQAVLESAYNANHAATSPTWLTTAFSLNNDNHYVDVNTNGSPFYQTYPGSSGAGSATGFTQTGLAATTTETNGSITLKYEEDHSIAYSGSNNFVVQGDAVQTDDRIDVNIGSTQDSILSSDGLSVFFRAGGGANSIGIWNANLHETFAPFQATNLTLNQWNNYAVGFNLSTDTLSIYTNEHLDGTINLATFDGGAYLAQLDANSTNYVGIGGSAAQSIGTDIGLLWTDNFQVGSPAAVPEPTTWALLLIGAVSLIALGRSRRSVR
jgi:hypothetical protein